MKKLTAGIFATLLTVVTVGAANANIASQGYVDDIKTALEADIDAKADSATTLAGYGITDAYTKTEVDSAVNLKENSANKADTTTATTELNKTSETLFPTVAATYKIAADAVAGVTTDVEGKVDVDQTAANANKAMITDETGNVTPGTIATGMIDANAVTNAKLADSAVTTTKIVDANVTEAKLATDAVTTAKIKDANVTKAKLESSVQTTLDDVAKKENTANKANTATATTSENRSSETLFPTVAATYKIAADAVAGVTTDVEGKVDIAQGAEDANKAVITDASGNVTVGQVASGMIADGAVTEAKIGTGAVTTTKLAADAVTNEKLADNAVQTANIANGAVTEAKLDTALVTKMNSLIANPGECANPANKCVLTYSGTDFAWEVIARGTSENQGQP